MQGKIILQKRCKRKRVLLQVRFCDNGSKRVFKVVTARNVQQQILATPSGDALLDHAHAHVQFLFLSQDEPTQ